MGMRGGISNTVERLEHAASAGDSSAMWHLATLYEHGYDSIPADTVRAIALLRASALKGYAPAQNYLGYLFKKGSMVAASRDSSLYWLERAAANGEPKALNNLAYMLITDTAAISASDSVRFADAISMLRRAADAGVPEAMAHLGDIYAAGKGVAPDTIAAKNYYLNATSRGLADAERRLWWLMGDKYNSLSPDSALQEGLKARDANAPTVAFRLFHKAAEAGIAQAYTLVADSYAGAKGVDYNHELSLQYYIKGALAGDAEAKRILKELLEIFPDILRDRLPEGITIDALAL